MNKTTYTADKNAFIIDGEVYLTHWQEMKSKQLAGYKGKLIQIGGTHLGVLGDLVTHSTKPLQGVKLLPREVFVKAQDIEELADKAGWEYSTFDQAASAFSLGFKSGYNANKNQFTKEEMESVILMLAHLTGTVQERLDKAIASVHPLSLPQEITIENDNVTVKW